MKTKLLLFAVFAQACLAESPIILGVRGGIPLNDVVQTVQAGGSLSSATDNYVVGPTIGRLRSTASTAPIPIRIRDAIAGLVRNRDLQTTNHAAVHGAT